MSKRSEWNFKYTVAQVIEGVKEKIRHHGDRLLFWEQKKMEVMAHIKDSGLDIKESLAGGNYSNVARGFEAQVVIDATMQRDLSECTNKIREHGDQLERFGRWWDVLKAQPKEAELDLDYEDYLFFFGRKDVTAR